MASEPRAVGRPSDDVEHQWKFAPRRSVGIVPAHTLRPATPERPIAATPLATFTFFGSLRSCLRESGISATASVAVHPRAARAQAECLGVEKGKRQKEKGGSAPTRRRIGEPACGPYDQAPTSEYFFLLPSDF